jgi:hypothetical protein
VLHKTLDDTLVIIVLLSEFLSVDPFFSCLRVIDLQAVLTALERLFGDFQFVPF